MRRARMLGVVIVAAAGALASGVTSVASADLDIQPPSQAKGAVIAKIMVPTVVRSRPGTGRVVWRASTQTYWGRGPQWLTVLAAVEDDRGREWLRVLLPLRPNGSTGWISRDRVLLARTPYWIDLSTRRRLVSVFRDGVLVRRFRAVVGAPATPTPQGLFSIYDPIRQTPVDGFLGPWALHLTAFSTVLENFGGGPGRVAIHGRDGASLRDPLGSALSHGCVRVDNRHVIWLAHHAVPGTPVAIHDW